MKKANLRRAGDALRRATEALISCLVADNLSPNEGPLFELHDNLDTAYRELETPGDMNPNVELLRRTLVRLGSCAAALTPYQPEPGTHLSDDRVPRHDSVND